MSFIPGAANLGVYPNPIGDLRNPAPSNEDIARVVTRFYFREKTAFGVNAPTEGLDELTGEQPEDFRAIVKRYASLPNAHRSFAALLRELWAMIRIIVSPPFDAEKFERDRSYPMPPRPQLASESDVWRREHAEQRGPELTQTKLTPRAAGWR